MVIKFRVWDKKEKKMIRSPDDADFNVVIVLPSLIQIHDKTKEMRCIKGDYLNKRFVPMLYIGLTDINKNEIYKDDIVSSAYDKWIVAFGNGSFYLKSPSTNSYMDLSSEIINWYDLEIIGNIWENPNLVKGGKNATK